MGSGGNGKGGGGEKVAKSLQATQYMVSSMARVRVRTQHMERANLGSEEGAARKERRSESCVIERSYLAARY
jgi:hypothetical protein